MNLTDNLFAGKFVRLAAAKPDDHPIMAKWTDNPECWRMTGAQPAMPRNTDYWVASDKQDKERKNGFSFRIRTLSDDRVIGYMDLTVSWSNQVTWIGIGIGDSDYWGRGYGSDAMRLGVNYAFRELGVYKVMLSVAAYNTRAIRAYEKVGFVHEGTARAMHYRDGQRFDMHYMGILRPEWETRLKEKE
jgi:RimJ/RimL family protein N-acetyltransferase